MSSYENKNNTLTKFGSNIRVLNTPMEQYVTEGEFLEYTSENSLNLLDGYTDTQNKEYQLVDDLTYTNGYIDRDGTIYSSSSTSFFITNIDVIEGETYFISGAAENRIRIISVMDANNNVLKVFPNDSSSTLARSVYAEEFTIPTNGVKMYVGSINNVHPTIYQVITHNDKYINIYPVSKIEGVSKTGQYVEQSLNISFINQYLTITSSNHPALYNGNNTQALVLSVNIGEKYHIKVQVRNLVVGYGLCDNSGNILEYSNQPGSITSNTMIDDIVEIPTNCSYMIISSIDYTPIVTKVTNIEQYGVSTNDVLYGKKWCVCGDSFTAGDNITDVIESGMYAGQIKVYKNLIANRNNMILQNINKGGMTLALPTSGSTSNCFANSYTSIDSDVDYITLYYGINDSHQSDVISLGTITDNTLNTFYGAWNVILAYLIENYPNAKIGILVSNGCDTDDYRLATIACAQKWGIPYIDLNGDERTPMMLRSTNPNIDADAKNSRLIAWRVSPSNTHPNVAAHEYESTFIENFLRSL